MVPVSLAFLWYNQNPLFDQDDPRNLGNYIAVYIIGISVWNCMLIPTSIAFLALQFLYEIETVRKLQSSGSLSLVGLLLQATAFILLAVAQMLRSWSGILWLDEPPRTFAHFLEYLAAFYAIINTHVAYFLTGVGFLILFFIILFHGQRSAGRIRL